MLTKRNYTNYNYYDYAYYDAKVLSLINNENNNSLKYLQNVVPIFYH